MPRRPDRPPPSYRWRAIIDGQIIEVLATTASEARARFKQRHGTKIPKGVRFRRVPQE